MKLCFGTAAQERVQCKKSKPGSCFFVTQHSLSKQQKGRRGQKKIKRKKNPFPSPTHTQTTVPNRGAIQGCSETGHKEKCLQIKPTPFFFFLNFCLGVFFFFFPNKHHGGPWKVLGIFESWGPADPFCPPLAQLPCWPRCAAPLWGSGPSEPPPPSLSRRGEPQGPRGRVGISTELWLLAWAGSGSRGEEGGVQGTPRVSHHKITHWSLWEPVALSPRHLVFFFFFWLFSGICCLFWETKKKAGRWDIRLGWIQSPGQPAEQHLGVHVHICIHISKHPSSTAWLFMPHSWERSALFRKEERCY